MNSKRNLLFFIIIACIVTTSVNAADAPPAPVILNLTDDAVKFFKFAVWIGGIFLAIFAAIGVAFFGFDVKKAHASISESVLELNKLLAEANLLYSEIKKTHVELTELTKKFDFAAADAELRIEELGAKIEEIADISVKMGPIDETLSSFEVKSTDSSRDLPSLIREVISGSNFDWTTIQRVMKKTGLSRGHTLEIIQQMPDIEISLGKKSKDHIFKLKSRN